MLGLASASGGVGANAGLLFVRSVSPVVVVAAGTTGARTSSATAPFAAWGVIASATVPCPPAVAAVGAATAAFIVARHV